MVKTMINNVNVKLFFEKYNNDIFLSSFKEMSGGSNGCLVESQIKAYNFDIIKETLPCKNKLRSADSLYIKSNSKKDFIFFIEFKTGFEKIINSKNFDERKWKCPNSEDKQCVDGITYFKKSQKLENKELMLSIHLKLIESFLIFEKYVLPNCKSNERCASLNYIAVIDGVNVSPLDAIESIMDDMGGCNSNENEIESFRNSLKKYIIKDSEGNNLLFDNIDVVLKEDFDKMFK